MDLTKLKMIRRQQMAVQVRSSQRMSCHRYWIAALLFILEATTTSAFQVQDTINRSPTRRTSVNGEDIDLTTLSSALSRRTILQIPSKKDHFVSLNMVKTRIGLEQRQESATPTEGGMTLYVKAGPDGTSLGDCPFAHFVRMVLEAKGLEYELKPSIQDTKPSWLIEYYDGKMPALRHRKECYVESDTIAAYLEFFFPKPELTPNSDSDADAAAAAVDGLFPAMARYIKHTPDGDEVDVENKEKLRSVLAKLNDHLSLPSRTGPYLVGNGSVLRMNDCKIAPILYHMCTAVPAYKGNDTFASLMDDVPFVQAYTNHMFQNDLSFQSTVYPADVVIWGWSNARSN